MERDIIFISHATPQDNYFAAWLGSKLKVLGYNVWLDLEDISAGDSFNTVIRPIIQERAKVFIATTTIAYATKAKNQNTGVARELNCAATVDTNALGHNFIFPIRVDGTDYNDFPYHYMGWNSINFDNNWQQGLIDLVTQLEKINVHRLENIDDPINIWFNAIKVQNRVVPKKEKYYSNWLKIYLPANICIHQPRSYIKEEIYKIPYPLIPESDRIISFMNQESTEKFLALRSSYSFAIEQFFSNNDLKVDEDFILKEPRKKLISLLNKSFQKHLSAKDLICWSRGKKKLFYFKSTPENQKPINLNRYGKPKGRRLVTGISTEHIDGAVQKINWHFALSAQADLEPIPHYKLFYTLVFTNQRFRRFPENIHHKLRRSVPIDWYNRKWLETLLAAVLLISASTESKQINISIDDNKFMKVDNEPFSGISKFGYNEPKHVE